MAQLHELVTATRRSLGGAVAALGSAHRHRRRGRLRPRPPDPVPPERDGRRPASRSRCMSTSGTRPPIEYVAMCLEGLGDTGHDPTVMLHRTRTVDGDGLTERITLVNRSRVDDRLPAGCCPRHRSRRHGRGPQRRRRRACPHLAPLPDGPGRTRLGEGRAPASSVTADPGDLRHTAASKPGEEFTITVRVTATSRKSTPASRSSRRPSARRTTLLSAATTTGSNAGWTVRWTTSARSSSAADGRPLPRRRPALVPHALRP